MLNLFKWIYRRGELEAALNIITYVQSYAVRDNIDSHTQAELYKIANGIRANYFPKETR